MADDNRFGTVKPQVRVGRPPLDSIELKRGDRVCLHTVSSGSAWSLMLGPKPYGKRGGRSKKCVDARKVAGSARGSKEMLQYTLDLMGRLIALHADDGEVFVYLMEQRLALGVIASMHLGTAKRDNWERMREVERVFDRYDNNGERVLAETSLSV